MIDTNQMKKNITAHMDQLVNRIGVRTVGSENNRNAQQYIAACLEELNIPAEQDDFQCLDWELKNVLLKSGPTELPVLGNHFSPCCDVTAPPVFIDDFDKLDDVKGKQNKIIVLHGQLTKDALMPKNFKFYNPEEHQKIIAFLEHAQPLAIIAVSHRETALAPIIEDGDFRIPSVTVDAQTGKQLLQNPNTPVTLRITSSVRYATGSNVLGRIPGSAQTGKKIILCAHFDTMFSSPGAIDNASGVTALLVLAQLLKSSPLKHDLEIIAFNGEDYYNSAGQLQYLEKHQSQFPSIAAAVNIDGIGMKEKNISVAYFECPEKWTESIERIRGEFPRTVRVEPWPQGDHSIFWPHNIPTLAFGSETYFEYVDTIIHTPNDNMRQIDLESIKEAILLIEKSLREIDKINT